MRDTTKGETNWPAGLAPRLQLFHDYWLRLRETAGGVPPKRAVDPLLIPRGLLPDIGLIELLPQPQGPWRIRYRLLGTGHRLATGQDLTGRDFADIYPPEQVATFEREYRSILLRGEPGYARRHSLKADREFVAFQQILAPLLDDEGQRRHLIGYWLWETSDQ